MAPGRVPGIALGDPEVLRDIAAFSGAAGKGRRFRTGPGHGQTGF